MSASLTLFLRVPCVRCALCTVLLLQDVLEKKGLFDFVQVHPLAHFEKALLLAHRKKERVVLVPQLSDLRTPDEEESVISILCDLIIISAFSRLM